MCLSMCVYCMFGARCLRIRPLALVSHSPTVPERVSYSPPPNNNVFSSLQAV